MGPEKNKSLFDLTAAKRVDGLSQEFRRREALGITLERLSTFFEKVGTTHNLTEPTILTRLYALSQVQGSHMGISGFEPLYAVGRDDPNGSVVAKKAPAHDDFAEDDGTRYKTRVINIVMPHYNPDENIEFYGLNLFVPSAKDEIEQLGAIENAGRPKLLVVNSLGAVINEAEPITGETIIFAVRNKKTGDAKAYVVEIEEEVDSMTLSSLGSSSRLSYVGEDEAIVPLHNGRQVKIKELSGELLTQVIDELRHGDAGLAKAVAELENLTEEQQRAVHASLSGYYEEVDFEPSRNSK